MPTVTNSPPVLSVVQIRKFLKQSDNPLLVAKVFLCSLLTAARLGYIKDCWFVRPLMTLKITAHYGQGVSPVMLCVDCALGIFGLKKTE
jgi:hypothetical protein